MAKNNPYTVLDFETGGYDCRKHAITEVAMIIMSGDTLQELGRYESYVKPYGYEYDQEALDFTGITLEKLDREGKELSVVVKEMCEVINAAREKDGTKSSHRKKPYLTGQNVKFDAGFLQQIYKETKTDIKSYFDGEPDFYGNFQPNTLDTIHLAKLTFGNDDMVTSYKLSLICDKLGLTVTDAHKAMNDVDATKDVVSHLTSRLRSGEAGSNSDKIRVRNNFHFGY